jgi:hypothetical protein
MASLDALTQLDVVVGGSRTPSLDAFTQLDVTVGGSRTASPDGRVQLDVNVVMPSSVASTVEITSVITGPPPPPQGQLTSDVTCTTGITGTGPAPPRLTSDVACSTDIAGWALVSPQIACDVNVTTVIVRKPLPPIYSGGSGQVRITAPRPS